MMKNKTNHQFVIARPLCQSLGNLVASVTARRDCISAQSSHVPRAMTNGRLSISMFVLRLTVAILCLSTWSSCNHPAKKQASLLLKGPIIIEIISKDTVFNLHPFTDMKDYGYDPQDIKQWKNRLIIYANTANPDELKNRLKEEYSKDSIVLFNKPFYNFNRSMCSDTVSSKDWDNIVLTANLVKDAKMQQEYLNYHQTQFQKWPEVSKGFCNANFQQLLVFKQGRQLVLVISIPKGESLDHLNPLTTKNNPRVDDWNKIMSKYQEGIEGTKKGETWVFAKSIPSTIY